MVTKALGLSLKEGMMLPPGVVLDMLQVQRPDKEENDGDTDDRREHQA